FCRQPDRVAVVTGGTDGIGFATAKYLARLGMHVIIAGNNDAKAQEVIRKIREETLNSKDLLRYIFSEFFYFILFIESISGGPPNPIALTLP
ncbi:Hypothetical predicted protein, partial [Marmota monax]